MHRLQVPVLAASSLAAVTVVAACSSSTRDAAAPAVSTTTATSTSSPARVATVTAPAATSASGAGSSAAQAGASGTAPAQAVGKCTENQLTADAKPDRPVQGQSIPESGPAYVVSLTFTNKSAAACTLTGYPGAATLDKSGNQRGQAKRVSSSGEAVTTITLRPGATAQARLEGSGTADGGADAGCGDLTKTPKILVTPPDTADSIRFAVPWPTCYGFNVHPVRLA